MKGDFLRTSVVLFCMIAIFVDGSLSYSAPSEVGPVIHFRQTSHTFPTVFEGTELTHSFVVSNNGTATLNIKKVTHS